MNILPRTLLETVKVVTWKWQIIDEHEMFASEILHLQMTII